MRGSSGGTRHRDLIATLNDKRGTTAVVNRSYAYNALNRPLTFSRENADGTSTVITADYDKAPGGCKGDWTNLKGLPRRGEGAMGCTRVNMGRRVFKKVETVTPAAPDSESGEDSDTPTETRTIITHHRYLYRGYHKGSRFMRALINLVLAGFLLMVVCQCGSLSQRERLRRLSVYKMPPISACSSNGLQQSEAALKWLQGGLDGDVWVGFRGITSSLYSERVWILGCDRDKRIREVFRKRAIPNPKHKGQMLQDLFVFRTGSGELVNCKKKCDTSKNFLP